jgi:F-type H+-transporting ATPase subunit alpha
MVLIGPQQIKGMVINLEHNRVGIVIFGNDRSVRQGEMVKRSFEIMNIPLSMKMFGRVIDGLGNDLTENSSEYLSDVKAKANIDTKAIGIIERFSVREPMQTGVKLIDSLIPIGCVLSESRFGNKDALPNILWHIILSLVKYFKIVYCFFC